LLEKLGQANGFTVKAVGPVDYEGQPVSSTRIRKAIEQRDFVLAARLLGRSYALEGRVGTGAGRGKKIGFPTANLTEIHQMLPRAGVYACLTWSEKNQLLCKAAAVNIGFRPTFGNNPALAIEAHLLDFDGELNGKDLQLYSFRFVREEKKFPGEAELRAQIEEDVAKVRAIVASGSMERRQ